ncbi:MAG: Wadjet anti-phage system protein JetD domain-containing protein, partial [Planctomycetota bacterium]
MKWTTLADLKAQVQRLWDRGLLLAPMAGAESIFPRRLTFKVPGARELSERFPDVRDWIALLDEADSPYRIEWRSKQNRVLGRNKIPSAIWIDTLDDALCFLGKRRVANQFGAMVKQTKEKQPELIPWLTRRPLKALELVEDWPQILEVVAWMLKNPRPKIYLRQIDVPQVHTKLIESVRGVLTELLDLVVPVDSIDRSSTGVSGFCRRYGFLEKPLRVRFRILDPSIQLLPTSGEQDVTLTQAGFGSLKLPITKVFITENEVNFLAFPKVRDAIVIFGAGYGFDGLAAASWLHEKKIYYWGDIDTHGFAILNQLRGEFPHVVSTLMNQHTLLHHKELWGTEKQPEMRTLTRLNSEENALYQQLQEHKWGKRVRLEQERVGF